MDLFLITSVCEDSAQITCPRIGRYNRRFWETYFFIPEKEKTPSKNDFPFSPSGFHFAAFPNTSHGPLPQNSTPEPLPSPIDIHSPPHFNAA
jgi:hypothetical protein